MKVLITENDYNAYKGEARILQEKEMPSLECISIKQHIQNKLDSIGVKVSNLEMFIELVKEHSTRNRCIIDKAFDDLVRVTGNFSLRGIDIESIRMCPEIPKQPKQSWKRPYKFHK